ncbi:MAG: UxaA family hydrolase [Mailhella sp.]|nr:UxaA family hydrolase [Mailhella sp.]
MPIKFLVHQKGDSVGVVTVEGVKAGEELEGMYMKEEEPLKFTVLNDIPVGHKVALVDMNPGDTVIKYGTDIGKVVAPIKKGEHVHVHNLKTKRW